MKWGRVVVIVLVIAGLLVAWAAPVVRAADVWTWRARLEVAEWNGKMSPYLSVHVYKNGDPSGTDMTITSASVVFSTGAYESVYSTLTNNGQIQWYRSWEGHESTVSVTFDIETSLGPIVGSLSGSIGAYDGYQHNIPVADWPDLTEHGFVAELSVSISGAATVRVGQKYTYTATMTGGVAPYSVVFQRVSTAHPSDDYTYAAQVVSGTTASQVIQFPRVDSAFEVGVTVTDSLGAVASDSVVVNAASEKPVVYAGIKWTNNGQDDLLEFRVSTSAFGGVWKSDAESLPTEGGAGVMWYTVLTPAPYLRASRYFVLRGGNPPANPYTVMISLVDEAGTDWTYVFSFDTSTMSEPGDWVDTTGGGGSESTLPSWLEALIAALRSMLLRVWEVVKTALVDMFKWLFVPTGDQMASLLPSGTMGAALLEGLPEYTGADTSSYTLMGHWKVDGEVVDVPLMTLDLESLGDSGFVTAVRLCVQAGMCIALVMMVVVLI